MVTAHVVLALVAWFAATLAPAARLACEDRALPERQRRGVSILPGWPLVPVVLSIPAFALGADHLLPSAISALHVGLLVYSVSYSAFWIRRRSKLDQSADHSQP